MTGETVAVLLLVLALASRPGGESPRKRVWATSSRGVVEVDGRAPMLDPHEQVEFESHVRQWETTAQTALAELTQPSRVTVPNVLGFIWAESRGNPRVRSRKGAIGLMQVLSAEARGGHSDAELVDPQTNVNAGVRYLNRIARAFDQLPELASKYNAGQGPSLTPHPSSSSPWGMREAPGYIDAVVRASNYAAALAAVPADIRSDQK